MTQIVRPLYGVFDEDTDQLVALLTGNQRTQQALPATSVTAQTILGQALAGLAAGSVASIAEADSILAAFAKLQAQVDSLMGDVLNWVQGLGVTLTATAPGQVTIAIAQDVSTTADVQFRDMRVRHFGGGSSSAHAPTLLGWGTGAGSNSTPTAGGVSGNDELIIVNVTPSATPAANAVLASIAFGDNFTSAPVAIVLPMSRAAAGIQGASLAAITATTAVDHVTLNTGASTALTAGTAYTFGVMLRRP